jgi:hypothetical protein
VTRITAVCIQTAWICSLFVLGITVRDGSDPAHTALLPLRAEEAWPPMRTELVGRERELAALVEHFESALAAHPRVVLCRGEPGCTSPSAPLRTMCSTSSPSSTCRTEARSRSGSPRAVEQGFEQFGGGDIAGQADSFAGSVIGRWLLLRTLPSDHTTPSSPSKRSADLLGMCRKWQLPVQSCRGWHLRGLP